MTILRRAVERAVAWKYGDRSRPTMRSTSWPRPRPATRGRRSTRCSSSSRRRRRTTAPIDADEGARQILQRRSLMYDKSGEEHYNIISALHKSLRNGDADAAVYWLVRMLEGGEDPMYIARRLVRAASEDIGNADPQALRLRHRRPADRPLPRHARSGRRAGATRHVSRRRAEVERRVHRLRRSGPRSAAGRQPAASRSTSATPRRA